jgi:glucoamylase
MALVWAHAEHIKLCRSLRDGRFFDQPPQAMERYIFEKADSPYTLWRFNHKCRTLPAGKTLRLEVLSPTVVHGRMNNWPTVHNTETRDTGLGVYVADLPTDRLHPEAMILFTFYWPEADRWEQVDFCVIVE